MPRAAALGCLPLVACADLFGGPSPESVFAGDWWGTAECGDGAGLAIAWSTELADDGSLVGGGELRAARDQGAEAWLVVHDLALAFDGAEEQDVAVTATVESCEGETSAGSLSCQPVVVGGPLYCRTTFSWDGADSVLLETEREPLGDEEWTCFGRLDRE